MFNPSYHAYLLFIYSTNIQYCGEISSRLAQFRELVTLRNLLNTSHGPLKLTNIYFLPILFRGASVKRSITRTWSFIPPFLIESTRSRANQLTLPMRSINLTTDSKGSLKPSL